MALHPELSIINSIQVIWRKILEGIRTGEKISITYQDLCMHPGRLWGRSGVITCPTCKRVLGKVL